MQKTPIEYLTHTWNPIAMLCTPVSAGCKNCWHLRMAKRLDRNPNIKMAARCTYHGGDPWLNKHELAAPLKRKKPSVIGVQFMGDLFHESISNDWIAAVYGVMAACPQHIFVILTKRLQRMWEWYQWIARCGAMVPFHVGEEIPDGASGEAAYCVMSNTTDPALTPIEPKGFLTGIHQPWPLPNVTPGASVENQKTANERLYWFDKISSAQYMVSCEPLLGFIDLGLDCTRINWVVAGAETGPGKRPMELCWARFIRDQCKAAGVPFFFKRDSRGSCELDGRIYEEVPW